MSPVVLGIDTSSSWCSAALVRGNEVFVRRAEVGSAHSDHLLTMVESVLTEAGTSLDQCDALAYSAGPGSFTGLRVGCAVVQGLAFGATLQVASIGSLDAIARSVVDDGDPQRGSVLVVQDARMGEVYWALFDRLGDTNVLVSGPALATPSGLRVALASVGPQPFAFGCGNAWSAHGAALDGLVERIVPRASADAVDVAALGVVACREGRLIAPEFASPLYVRNDVARTTAERRAAALAPAA